MENDTAPFCPPLSPIQCAHQPSVPQFKLTSPTADAALLEPYGAESTYNESLCYSFSKLCKLESDGHLWTPTSNVETEGNIHVNNLTSEVDVSGLALAFSFGGGGDSDRESILSDISEMADPVKEHLANMQVIQEAERCMGNALGLPGSRVWLALQRKPEEDEAEFRKRQRKTNFLSLAQEFAALKLANSDALPFNLHQQKSENAAEENDSSPGDEESAENVTNTEDASGTVIVQSTDTEIHSDNAAAEVVCTSSASTAAELRMSGNSIPDLVRDLQSKSDIVQDANVSDTSELESSTRISGALQSAPVVEKIEVPRSHHTKTLSAADVQSNSDSFIKSSFNMSTPHHSREWERENIRLKLVLGDDDDVVSIGGRRASHDNLASCRTSCASLRMCYVNEAVLDDDVASCCDDDSGLQMRPDVIANTVAVGHHYSSDRRAEGLKTVNESIFEAYKSISDKVELGAWKMSHYDQLSLQRLGVGQLQVIVNDQLAQIETLNIELMDCLFERDNLHRVQDSMLVDIEDLSGYLSIAVSTSAV